MTAYLHTCSLLLVGVIATVGCNKKDGRAAARSGSARQHTESPRHSARAGLTTYRALLDEASRADLDAAGLLIDFGTPGQHKYTRGGWHSGWGTTGSDHDTSWVALAAKQGYLELPAPAAAPAAIVVRARSKTAGQSLSFHVGGKELGQAKLTTRWSVIRVPLAAGALPHQGRLRLEVRAGTKATGAERAELDWLWLATADGAPDLGPRIKPLAIAGTTHRTLVAPAPRTYSFYLSPPPGGRLVVDLGAAQKADFVVTATTDAGGSKELLRASAERGWTEETVSLAALAGRAVRLDLTTANQQGEAGWGEPELMIEGSPPAPPPASAAPKNVIFVLMDTARADAYGPFARPDRVVKTPSYDAFAKRSTVFTAAYDNENWTKPSVATILSGLYPSTHDTKRDEDELPSDVELITEHLKAAGFSTAGFVANGYISDHFGFQQGWDSFRNYIRENRQSDAEYVFGDALAWQAEHLAKRPNQPYFLYVQTIDPHVTYRQKPGFSDMYFHGDYHGPLGPSIDAEDQVKLSSKKLVPSETDLSWLRALYYGEISYNDAELGKFLQELEKRGSLKDTLVVITNDHGEELGERGRYGHGHQVFEELIRAPLLIHYPPRFPGGKQIADVVEAVDLAPTILDALGKDPLKNADGVSFMPLVEGRSTVRPRYAVTEFLDARRVLRIGSWKLFAHPDGSADLFDLAGDPDERHELGDTAPILRRMCEIHLGEALATPDKATRLQGLGGRRQYRAGSAAISPQMRRQLEALGYFGSNPEATHAGSAR